MAVKQWANSRQMEFGIGMELYKGILYSIPQMTGYPTLKFQLSSSGPHKLTLNII